MYVFGLVNERCLAIDIEFPGWLINRWDCLVLFFSTGKDDRWYTIHRHLYVYQTDIVDSNLKHTYRLQYHL